MLVLAEMNALVPPHYEETFIQADYIELCEEIGTEYDICPELLMALIEKESSGHADAQNGSCKGLCQISEKWHSGRMEKLGVTDIYDIDGNIHVATDYLMELAEESGYGDISYVLDRYNGNSKAAYYQENGVMSKYASKILNRAQELETWADVSADAKG